MAHLILAGMAIVIPMTAVVLPPGWVGPRTRTMRPARTDGIRAVHPMAQADGRLLAFASGQPARKSRARGCRGPTRVQGRGRLCAMSRRLGP